MFDKIMEMYYKALSYLKTERGQALVEYALIIVLIAIVVITMLKATGQNVNKAFSTINSALQ